MIILSALLVTGCYTAKPYTWQDTRLPAREDATFDLEYCRQFAARQYSPGIPAGTPYLTDQKIPEDPTAEYQTGEWRPDRDPARQTSIQSSPIHNVPVNYTGYPGELDYYPDYLDDILEKCMFDKGWRYLPAQEQEETEALQKTNEPRPSGKVPASSD